MDCTTDSDIPKDFSQLQHASPSAVAVPFAVHLIILSRQLVTKKPEAKTGLLSTFYGLLSREARCGPEFNSGIPRNEINQLYWMSTSYKVKPDTVIFQSVANLADMSNSEPGSLVLKKPY